MQGRSGGEKTKEKALLCGRRRVRVKRIDRSGHVGIRRGCLSNHEVYRCIDRGLYHKDPANCTVYDRVGTTIMMKNHVTLRL